MKMTRYYFRDIVAIKDTKWCGVYFHTIVYKSPKRVYSGFEQYELASLAHVPHDISEIENVCAWHSHDSRPITTAFLSCYEQI